MDLNLPELLAQDLELSSSVFMARSMTAGAPWPGLADALFDEAFPKADSEETRMVDTDADQEVMDMIARAHRAVRKLSRIEERNSDSLLNCDVNRYCGSVKSGSLNKKGFIDSAGGETSAFDSESWWTSGRGPATWTRTRQQSVATAATAGTSLTGFCSCPSDNPHSPYACSASSSLVEKACFDRNRQDSWVDLDGSDSEDEAEPDEVSTPSSARFGPVSGLGTTSGTPAATLLSPRPRSSPECSVSGSPGCDSTSADSQRRPTLTAEQARPQTATGAVPLEKPRLIQIHRSASVSIPKRTSSRRETYRQGHRISSAPLVALVVQLPQSKSSEAPLLAHNQSASAEAPSDSPSDSVQPPSFPSPEASSEEQEDDPKELHLATAKLYHGTLWFAEQDVHSLGDKTFVDDEIFVDEEQTVSQWRPLTSHSAPSISDSIMSDSRSRKSVSNDGRDKRKRKEPLYAPAFTRSGHSGVPLSKKNFENLEYHVQQFPNQMLRTTTVVVMCIQEITKQLRRTTRPRGDDDSHSLFSVDEVAPAPALKNVPTVGSMNKSSHRFNMAGLSKLLSPMRKQHAQKQSKLQDSQEKTTRALPSSVTVQSFAPPHYPACLMENYNTANIAYDGTPSPLKPTTRIDSIRNVFPKGSTYLCDALYAHLVAYNYVTSILPPPDEPTPPGAALFPPGLGGNAHEIAEANRRIPKKAVSMLGMSTAYKDKGKGKGKGKAPVAAAGFDFGFEKPDGGECSPPPPLPVLPGHRWNPPYPPRSAAPGGSLAPDATAVRPDLPARGGAGSGHHDPAAVVALWLGLDKCVRRLIATLKTGGGVPVLPAAEDETSVLGIAQGQVVDTWLVRAMAEVVRVSEERG